MTTASTTAGPSSILAPGQADQPFGHFAPEPAPFSTAAVAASLLRLEEELEADGWDHLSQRLYSLWSLPSGRVIYRDMTVQPGLWTRFPGEPEKAIVDYAEHAIIGDGAPVPPAAWCGWGFAAEQLTMPPEEIERINATAGAFEQTRKEWDEKKRRMLEERDEKARLEIRSVYAVDSTLRRYSVTRDRAGGVLREAAWSQREGLDWIKTASGVISYREPILESPVMQALSFAAQSSHRIRAIDAYRLPAHPPGWFTEVWAEWHEWHSPRP